MYAFAAFLPAATGNEALGSSGNPAAPIFLLAMLGCVFPVAAVFARIASLLAIRNVYQALFAVVALGCTLLTVCFLSIASLRLAIRVRAPMTPELAASIAQLVEEVLVNYYALGLFLSVLLLSIRPWFSIQASGILSGMLVLPSFLFSWIVVEEHLLAPVTTLSEAYRSAPSFAFFLIVAVTFIGIAAHCIAHQHYFLEVTNLREILDEPRSPRGGSMPFGGGFAAN
ncbi:MAG: hypothetical protein HYU52_06425 [Acidobacteria bacterium]|nr:hypothetical protein [Acidobacteriota bacterium]